MSQGKKVSLFTKASQVDNYGERNEIEFFAEGTYAVKGDTKYITYKETELSGMEGTTTTLRIASEGLSIIRFGTYNSRLDFNQGKKTVTSYQTPYGSIPLTIDTLILEMDLKDEGKSKIHLKYSLESGGEQAFTNEIHISFQLSS